MSNANTYNRVRDFIERNNLLNHGDRILLSLSAGKDSMALLDFMLNLKDDFDLEVAIFHLNHLMRGDESDEDERFLLNISREIGIEIFNEKYDFRNEVSGVTSFEERARMKRYEIANKICLEEDFSRVATAHNRDDNIETIIMRMLTGTGIHGLAGISIRRDNIIRPLLFLSSEEIYNYLRDRNIICREDSSNKDNIYLRNYIRNTLLPVIYERFSGAPQAILSLGEISKEYSSMIDNLLVEKYNDLYEKNENNVIIDFNRFIDDKRIFKYVLSKAIRDYSGGFVHRGMLEEIVRKAKVNRSNLILYENSDILVKKTFCDNIRKIIISGNKKKINNDSGLWEYRIDMSDVPGNKIIKEINTILSFNYVDYDFFLQNYQKGDSIFVALSGYISYIIIRNRRRGDRIRLETGSKKVKDLMIEKKLDRRIKNILPLLIVNSKVAAFMIGFVSNLRNRVSADFFVNSSSKKILAIQRIGNYK